MMNSQKTPHQKYNHEWAQALDFLNDLTINGKEQEIIDAANLLKIWKSHNQETYDYTPGQEDELRDQVYGDDSNVEPSYLSERGVD